MKLIKARKKIMILALCSMFMASGVSYQISNADTTALSRISIGSDYANHKSVRFLNGETNIILSGIYDYNEYISVYVDKALVDYSSASTKPVTITVKYKTAKGEETKTINVLPKSENYYNSSYYRYYINISDATSIVNMVVKDPNGNFNKNYNIMVNPYSTSGSSLVPASTVNDLDKNNIVAYYEHLEKPQTYSGFIFSNVSSDKFFFRPAAKTDTITLFLGAANPGGGSYRTSDNKFIVKYYNTKETYDDIKKNGIKNNKRKYRTDQYYVAEVPASGGYVNLPWFEDHGIIELSLKTPDVFKVNLSVRANPESVTIGSPYTPSVDPSIYNTGSDIKPGVIAPAVDVKPVGVSRLAGDNRYETSLKLSKETFTSSPVAVVASGENFADALSGGGLAAAYNAPLLLVNNSYASDVNSELNRLGVKTVYVLGGQNSISSTIENKLSKNAKDEKRTVIRLAGENRYETSMAIYNELTKMAGIDKNPILVNGKTFADALSAGPLAAKLKKPIVLTNGKKVSYLIDKSNPRNIIIGGYKSMDGSFLGDRIYGDNRYETAASIANRFYNPQAVMIASGVDYPDGLSAITLYNKYNSPLLLTSKYDLPKQVKSYIKDQKVGSVIIVGGQGSVSNSVENELK